MQQIITLLKHMPAARNAILYRFGCFFQESVRLYIDYRDLKKKQEAGECLILVSSVFMSLINDDSIAWSEILSSWVIKTIEKIILAMKKKKEIPPPNNISATLNFWLSIHPMKVLLDIYMKSLKVLIDQKHEASVDSLLSAPPPFFDWLIADVGNTFPQSIVERVFHSGFNKFSMIKWGDYSSSKLIKSNENEQSVVASVIRILNHLHFQHQQDVTEIIVRLFQNPPTNIKNGKIKVFLYLLGLFTQSSLLFQSAALMLMQIIDVDTLNKLYIEYESMTKPKKETVLVQKLIVNLICQTNNDSYKFLNLLLSAACGETKNLSSKIQDLCQEIMPDLIRELQQYALQSMDAESMLNSNSVFLGLFNNKNEIISTLLETNSIEKKKWLQSILTIMCMKNNPKTILANILTNINLDRDLNLFLKMFNEVNQLYSKLMEAVLSEYFDFLPMKSNKEALKMLKNVLQLMTMNYEYILNANDFPKRLQEAVSQLVDRILMLTGRHSATIEINHLCVQLLYQVLSKTDYSRLRLGTRTLNMSQRLVNYFFRLLHNGYVNHDVEMQTCQQTIIMVSHICDCFEIISVHLLESALSKVNSVLFGRRKEKHIPKAFQEISLLQQLDSKRKRLAGQNVYSTGSLIAVEMDSLGRFPKRKKDSNPQEIKNSHKECIALLLYRCCSKAAGVTDILKMNLPQSSQVYDGEKLITLASTLLNAIASSSPSLSTSITVDGDYEWPLVLVRRLTIERDLKMFNFLIEHTFIWHIMSLCAYNREAFWKISPIIRSCLSVLISHFETCLVEKNHNHLSHHFLCAVQIVQLLSKAQFLPEPLCYISELFDHVTNYEIFLLLSVIWNFVKDHAIISLSDEKNKKRPFERVHLQPYVSVVQSILHQNITSLYHFFPRFIVKIAKF